MSGLLDKAKEKLGKGDNGAKVEKQAGTYSLEYELLVVRDNR